MLRKARVPNAVPYLFTALKIAAPTSVITAFVAEYFGGNQNGLGSRITSNVAIARNAVGWAYVVGACVRRSTFYLVSVALESITCTCRRRRKHPGEKQHDITKGRQHASNELTGDGSRGVVADRRCMRRRR